jgi:hypothetical protein
MGYMFDLMSSILRVPADTIKFLILLFVAFLIELVIYQCSPDIRTTRGILHFFRRFIPKNMDVPALLKNYDEENKMFEDISEVEHDIKVQEAEVLKQSVEPIEPPIESIPEKKSRKPRKPKTAKTEPDGFPPIETLRKSPSVLDNPQIKEYLEQAANMPADTDLNTIVPVNLELKEVPFNTTKELLDTQITYEPDDQKIIHNPALIKTNEQSKERKSYEENFDKENKELANNIIDTENNTFSKEAVDNWVDHTLSYKPKDEDIFIQNTIPIQDQEEEIIPERKTTTHYRFGRASREVIERAIQFINKCITGPGEFAMTPNEAANELKFNHRAKDVFIKNLSMLKLNNKPLIFQKDGDFYSNFTAKEIIDYMTEEVD